MLENSIKSIHYISKRSRKAETTKFHFKYDLNALYSFENSFWNDLFTEHTLITLYVANDISFSNIIQTIADIIRCVSMKTATIHNMHLLCTEETILRK